MILEKFVLVYLLLQCYSVRIREFEFHLDRGDKGIVLLFS